MNDTEVVVYVSEKNRSESFRMPDCNGLAKSSAVSKIASRFRMSEDKIRVVEEYNDAVEAGKVYKTTPEADAFLSTPSTTEFVIYVSLGAKPVEIQMPSVRGETAAQAENTLSTAGFKNVTKEYIDSNQPKDAVLDVNYPAGTLVSEVAQIVLKVSNGSLVEMIENIDSGSENTEPDTEENTSDVDTEGTDDGMGGLLNMSGRQ